MARKAQMPARVGCACKSMHRGHVKACVGATTVHKLQGHGIVLAADAVLHTQRPHLCMRRGHNSARAAGSWHRTCSRCSAARAGTTKNDNVIQQAHTHRGCTNVCAGGMTVSASNARAGPAQMQAHRP